MSFFLRSHRIIARFGLDIPKLLRAFIDLPFYIKDYVKFRKVYDGPFVINPCLNDRHVEAGAVRTEYFWQDLLVAQAIHEQNPVRHIDVGSRIDGFVANVASFRPIDVIDVRPVDVEIPGVTFLQADLMDRRVLERNGLLSCCDSLTCLHAIEHFGLGRYGDPIEVNGYRRGIVNMAALLRSGGFFYLSTPIGRQRVEFNANWVFDPRVIVDVALEGGLQLTNLSIISSKGQVSESSIDAYALAGLATQDYLLGLFRFIKK